MDLPDNNGRDGWNRVVDLKHDHPHLKVLLAIGGWHNSSDEFSDLAANATARAIFVEQSADFLIDHDFDGIDFDWHFPEHTDRDNFGLLLSELSAEYRQHDLLVTTTIAASQERIDESYDLDAISKAVDYCLLLTYDMHGPWDKRVLPNAPLSDESGSQSIEKVVEHLIYRGVPEHKLILGLPFYGRTFVTEFDGNLGDVADDTGFKGPYSNNWGFMGFNEICEVINVY